MERNLLQHHTAFFWLQGHSDASGNAEMRNNYGNNFENFVRALRATLLVPQSSTDHDKVACLPWHAGTTTSLNFPLIASELDWPVDCNSKSSMRFAKRLAVVNRALETACQELQRSGIPCTFATFPKDNDAPWFVLTHWEDGHCNNGGLISLGRNLMRCFMNSLTQDD